MAHGAGVPRASHRPRRNRSPGAQLAQPNPAAALPVVVLPSRAPASAANIQCEWTWRSLLLGFNRLGRGYPKALIIKFRSAAASKLPGLSRPTTCRGRKRRAKPFGFEECGKANTRHFFKQRTLRSVNRVIDDRNQNYKSRTRHPNACEKIMIAPSLERAPRMLLVIGEDEQGLPMETIILEPSVSHKRT